MPSTRLEPAVPAIELMLTYAYDHAATGIVFKTACYVCVCVCVYHDMYKIICSKPELFRIK